MATSDSFYCFFIAYSAAIAAGLYGSIVAILGVAFVKLSCSASLSICALMFCYMMKEVTDGSFSRAFCWAWSNSIGRALEEDGCFLFAKATFEVSPSIILSLLGR